MIGTKKFQLYCARQQQWRDEAGVASEAVASEAQKTGMFFRAPYGVPSRAKLSGARF